MKKILFLIHNLGPGGAEKVLVNLVNNMDYTKYDITVLSLFDVGVNKQFLNSNITYKYCFKKMFRGNSHIMKAFTPKHLHNLLIKDEYDIEISYLEGPCARIISGCSNPKTKKVAWIHIEQHTPKNASKSFRNISEATICYNTFDRVVCVAESVKKDFTSLLDIKTEVCVLYNTNETEQIKEKAIELITDVGFDKDRIKLIAVGKLLTSKGFDRILKIVSKLVSEGYPIHFYILGEGPEENNLKAYVKANKLEDIVSFLGYQVNPYKYINKCDLFICASFREGFSTATTEALILGIPVCTVKVSGMQELLGYNNEYGIVTDNDEESLYFGIKRLLDNNKLFLYYKEKALERGHYFNKDNTVKAVENMLESI